MSFFDYPTIEGQPTTDPVAEIFWPDTTDEDWATLLRYCSRRQFARGDVVLDNEGNDRCLYLIVDGTLDVLALNRDGSVAGRAGSAP